MIFLPSGFKILQKKENKAVFEVEGLYPGYGTTLGNSLRRTLLSSLEGAAVTQVKIEEVQHEFSTIPGILEDVITIILNLKKLRFKIHSEGPQEIFLQAKGEGEIKGADLKIPSELELVNKEIHIATLTDKKAKLSMKLLVEKGLGYLIAEQGKKEKLEIGQISVDAIFTPVKSVNFKVEDMRVGKRTDFGRLLLEIETDGTITPEIALTKATKILIDHFSLFLQEEKEGALNKKKGESREEDQEEKGEEKSDVQKIKIEDMKISERVIDLLLKENIKTVSGLIKKSEASLMEIEGLGEKGIKEIKKGLKKIGLELK